jgi:multidrug transporter EmrE-like cation transporter|tara:strand:- start:3280 stop:3645 length:366 start_codon:yes stop_codon:yes gene_type:complete
MKTIYFAMAILAAFLFVLGDTIWKYRFHGQTHLGFFDLVQFWSLPTTILIALILSFVCGGIAKLVTLVPLKEANLSTFLPIVIVFTVVFLTISGTLFFNEGITPKKIGGVIAAFFAIYLLR